MPASSFVRRFNDLGLSDVPLVGGKNASLGELYRGLGAAGVRVPNGLAIRHAIVAAEVPSDLREAIVRAYEALGQGEPIDVAMGSSATAEDLPDASFAGQPETFLNVRGRDAAPAAALSTVS